MDCITGAGRAPVIAGVYLSFKRNQVAAQDKQGMKYFMKVSFANAQSFHPVRSQKYKLVSIRVPS